MKNHSEVVERISKIFLLCVGAQKGGTTWLYDYLSQNPNVNLGFMKEYHVFDALFVNEEGIRRRFLQSRINAVVNTSARPAPEDVVLLKFLGEPSIYFDYFQTLLQQNSSATLTGDITPSYSALPVEALSYIKDELEKRDFEVKVVFLMRDPVNRCISATRMALRQPGAKPTVESEINHLTKNYQTDAYQIRTRYDNTIRNVEQVFDASQIHYAFYEELFSVESVRKICDFLAIPFINPDFNRRPNESRTSNLIPSETRDEIAKFYRPVYEFISERFGTDRIDALWPSNIGTRSRI